MLEQLEPCVGTYNVKHQPLVDPNDVYLPPLHIKLGLIKNFVKAMNLQGAPKRPDTFENLIKIKRVDENN